jgi:hypothetical protein
VQKAEKELTIGSWQRAEKKRAGGRKELAIDNWELAKKKSRRWKAVGREQKTR